MMFDDYNYKMYNKFILKDPNHSQGGFSEDSVGYTMGPQSFSPNDINSPALRQNMLQNSELDDYQHA